MGKERRVAYRIGVSHFRRIVEETVVREALHIGPIALTVWRMLVRSAVRGSVRMWNSYFRHPVEPELPQESRVPARKAITVKGQMRNAQVVHLLDLSYLAASTGEMTSAGVLISGTGADLIFDLDGRQIPPNQQLFEGTVAFQAIETGMLHPSTLRIFREKWQPGWLRGGRWTSIDLRKDA